MAATDGEVHIEFSLLDDYIDRVLTPATPSARGRGKREKVGEILELLAEAGLVSDKAIYPRFREWVKQQRAVRAGVDVAKRLLLILHGELPANYQKLFQEWAPRAAARVRLPSGNARLGEIQIMGEAPDGNLIRPEHAPVDKYVAVFVDKVAFRQRHKGSGALIDAAPGNYIRIEIPGDPTSAVVLPIDFERGRVLLVTQYRHPQRAWLTELPRGFGWRGERDAAVTALRELFEETGARPERGIGAAKVVPLRTLHTDTSKLLDTVAYFLVYVDPSLAVDKLVRLGPLMENPLWVDLRAFLRAVFSEDGVELDASLEGGSIDWELPEAKRRQFFAATELDGATPRLRIRDAFTVTATLLALPHLAKRFASKRDYDPRMFDPAFYA